MRKKITFFILLIMLLMGTTSFAFTNICKIGKKILGMTTAQMQEFYEDELARRRIEGSGVVSDVQIDSPYSCKIVVRCVSDAFIYINVDDCRGSIKDLKLGQAISFTGDCFRLDQRYYQNSSKRYIRVFVINPFLEY